MIKTVFIRLIAVILIFALILACISCGIPEGKDGGDTVVFTDALGRRVEVEKQPTRVAALLGSFADVWSISGGTLCAAPTDAWEDFDIPLDGAVNLGGAHSPSLELLISAEPHFVIASANTASNLQMEDALSAMGITVAYFEVDNFTDYLNMLDICTDITGRKDLYQQNGLLLQAQIEEIKNDYKNTQIPTEQKKVLLLRAASSFVKAKGKDGTILGEMLTDMGCINIADTDSSLLENLSVERIMKEEPYHIFVVTMGANEDAAIATFENMVKENSAWGTLSAFKEGRVHYMDKTLFNLKPNARYAESYRILYEKLLEK